METGPRKWRSGGAPHLRGERAAQQLEHVYCAISIGGCVRRIQGEGRHRTGRIQCSAKHVLGGYKREGSGEAVTLSWIPKGAVSLPTRRTLKWTMPGASLVGRGSSEIPLHVHSGTGTASVHALALVIVARAKYSYLKEMCEWIEAPFT